MKLFLKLSAFVCLSLPLFAQNYSTVTAANIQNVNQQKLPAGQMCMLATDSNDTPINFQAGGGGQVIARAFCTTVANGAVTNFLVPNPANTIPANIGYRITVTDTSTGQIVLKYTKVQFVGSPFNFDNYSPIVLGTFAPLSGTSTSGSLSVNGNLAVTGTFAPGAVTTGDVTSSGTVLAKRIENIREVDSTTSGATADAKIATACADLPSTGGIIDARGFGAGPQTVSSTISCGSLSKPVGMLFDPATSFVPSTTSTDVFAVQPFNVVDGLSIDPSGVTGYTGSAIKYAGATFDGNIAQKTILRNVRVHGGSLTTGTAVLIQSDDTNFVSFLDLIGIHIDGLANAFYLHATGSTTGKWITQIKVQQCEIYGSVIGVNMLADKGNIEAPSFSQCSYQKTASTTYAIQLSNPGGGVFENPQFDGFNIWDTSPGQAMNIVHATPGVIRVWFRGRFDGSCTGDCGTGSAEAQFNSFINSRFADSGVAYILNSYAGIWTGAHSGNGYDINLSDFSNRLWMHGINGTGSNGCDVGQRCTEFGSSGIGIASVMQHNGSGQLKAGIGAGTFIGGTLYNGSGAFIGIPNGVSGAFGAQVVGAATVSAGNTFYNGTATLTYTAIAAQTSQEQTMTITGASTTNFGVACSPRATLGNANLGWSAWVSATNTVSVRVTNPTTGSVTPSAVAWGCHINQ